MRRIGLISDTHGLLRPEALRMLRDCDHILHSGDIGTADVIQALEMMAPVTAVRGNNDKGAWAARLPETEMLKLGETYIYLLHDVNELDLDPVAAGVRVVVSGHSHRPAIHARDAVLYVNPGSAGPRRFKLPIAVGELLVDGDAVSARIIELDIT
jgi:hypothetical protein